MRFFKKYNYCAYISIDYCEAKDKAGSQEANNKCASGLDQVRGSLAGTIKDTKGYKECKNDYTANATLVIFLFTEDDRREGARSCPFVKQVRGQATFISLQYRLRSAWQSYFLQMRRNPGR